MNKPRVDIEALEEASLNYQPPTTNKPNFVRTRSDREIPVESLERAVATKFHDGTSPKKNPFVRTESGREIPAIAPALDDFHTLQAGRTQASTIQTAARRNQDGKPIFDRPATMKSPTRVQRPKMTVIGTGGAQGIPSTYSNELSVPSHKPGMSSVPKNHHVAHPPASNLSNTSRIAGAPTSQKVTSLPSRESKQQDMFPPTSSQPPPLIPIRPPVLQATLHSTAIEPSQSKRPSKLRHSQLRPNMIIDPSTAIPTAQDSIISSLDGGSNYPYQPIPYQQNYQNLKTTGGILPSFSHDPRSELEKQKMRPLDENEGEVTSSGHYESDWNDPSANAHQKSLTELASSTNFWKIMKNSSQKLLEGVETVGEYLADTLGVTSPRYGRYLDDAMEYDQMVLATEEREKEKMEQKYYQRYQPSSSKSMDYPGDFL